MPSPVTGTETGTDANLHLVDVLRDWAYVEADFQRDYNIDLSVEIKSMTWRRFSILLNGLSGDSVYVTNFRALKEGHKPIEDDDQAEKAVDNFFR